MENISNNFISTKPYETHNPFENLSSSRKDLQSIGNVQNNKNDSSPQCADLNTPIISKNQKMVSKEKERLEQFRFNKRLHGQLIDLLDLIYSKNLTKELIVVQRKFVIKILLPMILTPSSQRMQILVK